MTFLLRSPKRIGAGLGVLAVACLVAASFPTTAGAAGAGIGLGTATPFAVLAGSGVTNTGPSVINGNLGSCPAASITGFPPGIVNGTIHRNDSVACGAQDDTTIAYDNAAGRAATTTYAGPTNLGGKKLVGGVYKSPTSFSITGTLTLDGQNDPNSSFIFQAGSTVITAKDSSVSLINGAQACNVFWQVGSSGTLGVGSTLVGTMIALTTITANTDAVVQGRLLARNGAVTLDSNRVTRTACAPPPTTTTSPTSTSSSSTSSTSSSTTSTTVVGATTTTGVGPTTTTSIPPTTTTGVGPTTTTSIVATTTSAVGQTTTTIPQSTTTAVGAATTTTSTRPVTATTATTAVNRTSTVRSPGTPTDTHRLPRTGSVPPWEPIVGFALLLLGISLRKAARPA